MFSHPDPEVLVVGAGPVGLVAALFLKQDGVDVKIGLTAAPSERGANEVSAARA